MYLQPIIKIALTVLCLLTVNMVMAQPFQTSKYSREYNPYFEFPTFERGENSKVLSKKLDQLDLKPRTKWTAADSIEFAEISLLTNNIKLSHYYLQNIENRSGESNHAMKLLIMDCYIEQDFKTGDRIINKHFNTNLLSDQFFLAIYNTHKKLVIDQITDSIIFNFLPSNAHSLEKGSTVFNNTIIKPLETASQTLSFFVKFIHEDDPTIARAFNELGLILEHYVSLNQAYIAFSIARIYNKKDNEILENVKRIKAKHVQKNYNTPQFRSYFPRIEYWRFDYEILKEKIINEKKDTIPKSIPNLLAPAKEEKFPFSLDLLIPIGIALILLLFAIFTKSKSSG